LLAEAVRAAFRREYVSPSGRLVSDAPTAVALALRFELLLPEQRDTAGRRLVALVKAADHRVATGFVGTPIICDALCDVGAFPRPRVTMPAGVLFGAAQVAHALGSDGFHPERVLKLVRSTNIVADVLHEHGYTYGFDLRAALADWRDAHPRGEFV